MPLHEGCLGPLESQTTRRYGDAGRATSDVKMIPAQVLFLLCVEFCLNFARLTLMIVMEGGGRRVGRQTGHRGGANIEV